jgi:hypothetical protein
MVRGKDMEHLSTLVEIDTLGSGCRMSNTGMELKDGQVELYIKDNSNKVIEKVTHITGMQMALSIMDSTRMISYMEREFAKRKASYTESNMKKTTL